jgi:signal peptidase II
MPRKRTVFLTIVILGVAVDLWTKHIAFEALEKRGGRIVVIENFFHLYEMRNPGMAWSLFQGVDRRVWIVIRGVLALVLFGVYWSRPRVTWWANLGFAFVIAGAIGNLYDNCFAPMGHVRDFILLIFWGWRFPVFNVADAMITLGAPILLLYFAEPKKPDGGKKAAA